MPKTYSAEEVEAAKARNRHIIPEVGFGNYDPAPNSADRFSQYIDTMIGEGVSFADAHYTLTGVPASRPDESLDVKTQLSPEQQRQLLEFVREHEEWDRQEREAKEESLKEFAARTTLHAKLLPDDARAALYEDLKAEFEPEDGEDGG